MTMVWLLLAGLLWVLVANMVVSGVSWAIFWYEISPTPYRETFRQLAHGRPMRMLLWLAAGSLFHQLLLVLFYPLGWRGCREATDGQGPVVLLVHGAYHNASGWWFFRRRLAAAGFASIRACGYSVWRQDFDTLAHQLADQLRDLRVRHTGRPLLLVGHSLGGLLLRQALAEAGSDGVAGVVFLGSPHHGSKLAALAAGSTVRGLAWQGPLVTRLNATALAPGLPVCNLRSPTDNMVLPPEASQTPAGAQWQEALTPPVSHVGLLYDRRVAAMVIDVFRTLLDRRK